METSGTFVESKILTALREATVQEYEDADSLLKGDMSQSLIKRSSKLSNTPSDIDVWGDLDIEGLDIKTPSPLKSSVAEREEKHRDSSTVCSQDLDSPQGAIPKTTYFFNKRSQEHLESLREQKKLPEREFERILDHLGYLYQEFGQVVLLLSTQSSILSYEDKKKLLKRGLENCKYKKNGFIYIGYLEGFIERNASIQYERLRKQDQMIEKMKELFENATMSLTDTLSTSSSYLETHKINLDKAINLLSQKEYPTPSLSSTISSPILSDQLSTTGEILEFAGYKIVVNIKTLLMSHTATSNINVLPRKLSTFIETLENSPFIVREIIWRRIPRATLVSVYNKAIAGSLTTVEGVRSVFGEIIYKYKEGPLLEFH